MTGDEIRYTYDANGERTGYEYVEPERQPSGMAQGANYYPFKDRMLRYEEEEETTWTKSSARRVVDAKAKEAQAAVWAADAAYEQVQACAPGSTMEYAARKAWEEANRARSEARAAQAAVENAKTPMSLSKAVSSAETAARNAQAAADKAQTNADRAVESARAWANAGQGMTADGPEVDNSVKKGACVLINKKVDNAASLIGIEHMSALFQSSEGEWFFFFWGDVVVFEKIEDDAAFESLDALNGYLYDHRLYADKDKPYISSVYISGDFNTSIEVANELFDIYDKTKDETSFIPNRDYDVVFNNCTQVSMHLFCLGTLPDGTSVEDFMREKYWASISALPNLNMYIVQSLFSYDDVHPDKEKVIVYSR